MKKSQVPSTLLAAAVRRLNLTVTEAARICNVPYITFWRHWNGSRRLFGDVAARYADALNIPRCELRPDLWPPETAQAEDSHAPQSV